LGEICKWRGSVVMATVVCEGAFVCVYMVIYRCACACVCVSNKRGTPCDCSARFYGTPPHRILVYSHTHAYKHFPSSKSCPTVSLSLSPLYNAACDRAHRYRGTGGGGGGGGRGDGGNRSDRILGACACAPVYYNIMYLLPQVLVLVWRIHHINIIVRPRKTLRYQRILQ